MDTLHRCSDDMSATYNKETGRVILFDTRGYSPARITTILSGEMNELMDLYINGCCLKCFDPVDGNKEVCSDCFEVLCFQR